MRFLTATLLLLSLGLVFGRAHSQDILKPVPPITGETKASNEFKKDSQDQPSLPTIVPPTVNVTGANTKQDKLITREESTHYSDWAIAFFTLCLVIVTGTLARYTYFLWKSTAKLVSDSSETSQKQLRAYVAVVTSSIDNLRGESQPRAKVIIKNFGQTPAYELRNIAGMAWGTSFDNLPEPSGKPLGSVGVLAPSGIFEWSMTGPILNANQYSALTSGQMTLYVYGKVLYRDAFGTGRFLNYRMMTGGPVGIAGNALAICEEGNDAN